MAFRRGRARRRNHARGDAELAHDQVLIGLDDDDGPAEQVILILAGMLDQVIRQIGLQLFLVGFELLDNPRAPEKACIRWARRPARR